MCGPEYRAVPEYGGARARDCLSAPLFTGHCAPARHAACARVRVATAAFARQGALLVLLSPCTLCVVCTSTPYCTHLPALLDAADKSMARDHCGKAHLWFPA